MIINNQSLTTVYRALSLAFASALAAFSAKPDYKEFTMEVPSSTLEEEYGWLGNWPRLREWVGDRVVKSLSQFGFRIKNKTFEGTIGVSRDELEDNRLTGAGMLAQGLGEEAAKHPGELAYALLNNAFTTLCFDGQYMCDTDHPYTDENGVVQSYSNTGGGSGAPWFLIDGSRTLKPVIHQKRREYAVTEKFDRADENVFMRNEYLFGVDGRCNVGFGLWQLIYGSKATLDAAAFSAAYDALIKTPRDGGSPLGVMPTILLVGASNRAAAEAILDKALIGNGESNTNYKRVKLIVTPYLA